MDEERRKKIRNKNTNVITLLQNPKADVTISTRNFNTKPNGFLNNQEHFGRYEQTYLRI